MLTYLSNNDTETKQKCWKGKEKKVGPQKCEGREDVCGWSGRTAQSQKILQGLEPFSSLFITHALTPSLTPTYIMTSCYSFVLHWAVLSAVAVLLLSSYWLKVIILPRNSNFWVVYFCWVITLNLYDFLSTTQISTSIKPTLTPPLPQKGENNMKDGKRNNTVGIYPMEET